MKTAFKLFWVIAIVTVTVFSMTSCLSLGGGSSSARTSSTGTSIEWPSEVTWEKHGVTGGLLQPPGTTVVFADSPSMGPMAGQFIVTLHNADILDFNNIVSQIEAKNGWKVLSNDSDETGAGIRFVFQVSSTVAHTLTILFENNELVIIPEIMTR